MGQLLDTVLTDAEQTATRKHVFQHYLTCFIQAVILNQNKHHPHPPQNQQQKTQTTKKNPNKQTLERLELSFTSSVIQS